MGIALQSFHCDLVKCGWFDLSRQEKYSLFEDVVFQALGRDVCAKEMDEQIEESKEHADRFRQTLAKAAKRFAALAKVEERHANHYRATLARVTA